MTTLSPWWLLALAPVLAAALWALYRPWRQIVVVGSLSLWEKAAAAMGSSSHTRSRRTSLSWLCLLAGAVAAVLAASDPVHVGKAPARRVAVAPVPSTELVGEGGLEALRKAAADFLDRLSPDDQVRLVVPFASRDSGWMSPSQAKAQLSQVRLLPIRAAAMLPHASDGAVQHAYYFVPAGASVPAGAEISMIEVASVRPPVTLGSLGAESVGQNVQAFLAVEPNGTKAIIEFQADAVDAAGVRKNLVRNLPADSRNRALLEFKEADAIAISWTQQFDGAYLVRRQGRMRKVAIVGADNPLVRRFVQVRGDLQLVASPAEADVVIANETDAPEGKPALVIASRTEPSGWRFGRELTNLSLARMDVAANEIMRDVHLEGVVARRARTLIPGDQFTQKVVASVNREAVILADDGAEGSPRRVWVQFAMDARNTNFGLQPGFVVFLDNVMNYLLPDGEAQTHYGFQTPLQAGPHKDWTRIHGLPVPDGASDQLLWPGIYKDPDGLLHAISLPGLKCDWPKMKPEDTVASLPLPPPQPLDSPLSFWPGLLAAAVGLWLVGWGLRLRV